MSSPDSEDPELDFTNYMEKQKAALAATSVNKNGEQEEPPLPTSPVLIRGIIFFGILLVLLGVLIFLYMSRPEGGKVVAPEGFRIIESKNAPPRLEKNQ